jgi:G3E family GTPase
MEPTIPIWLVVGFLGAGKTTLLRKLVHAARGRRLVYIVNEFSAVDVDAALIEREGGVALAVAGGSIFCRCLVTEFVSVLRRVSDGIPGRDGAVCQPDGVVIEASGMADPRSMRRLLAESGLDARFHVAGVTAVVDPGTLMKLLLVLPNIRGQIESADLILLNKTDLHAPEMVEKVRDKIKALNSQAAIIRCTYGAIDPAVVLADGVSARTAEVDAAFGLCKDSRFEREVLVFARPVEPLALRNAFSGCDDGFYRAKGIVLTTEGWVGVDWSAGTLDIRASHPASASALVLIWNPACSGGIVKNVRALRDSAARPPASGIE